MRHPKTQTNPKGYATRDVLDHSDSTRLALRAEPWNINLRFGMIEWKLGLLLKELRKCRINSVTEIADVCRGPTTTVSEVDQYALKTA